MVTNTLFQMVINYDVGSNSDNNYSKMDSHFNPESSINDLFKGYEKLEFVNKGIIVWHKFRLQHNTLLN